ncbi:hypothetical protein GOP47_0025817 [Adiantum capillus-veneris]|uniref:G domain-containing protein n=1 Tax=Adiantum capillus-veneris TaxID=13818 RepID=A0A9D4Z2H3_ADICA|nr:hypothetical protein GOP47_0025817 [Adiantum capillus-veneris]
MPSIIPETGARDKFALPPVLYRGSIHGNCASSCNCTYLPGRWLCSASEIAIRVSVEDKERHKYIRARANGAAEFSTLSEQKNVDLEAPSTLLDDKHMDLVLIEAQDQGTSKPETDKGSALKGIFPGGLRRAEVRLPGLIMMVKVSDALGPLDKDFLDKLDSAVAAGFTMVVLESGGSTGGDDSSSGARLYEAACLLKAMLRGRAELLIADRVDITAAAGAGGVLLSDDGLSTVVARSMLQNVNPDNSVLPLVARRVSSAESALLATASEGADFLILQGLSEPDAKVVIDSIRERVSIPIFLQEVGGLQKAGDIDFPFLQAGANGLLYDSLLLKDIPAKDVGGLVSLIVGAMSTILQRRTTKMSKLVAAADVQGTSAKIATNFVTAKSSSLDVEFRAILEEERTLLTSMIKLLQEASPEMEEVSLLVDAVVQLDEPFLLMVVGEFNSGKSSVINALLGKRYLPEGVLPTTNEIALLKHAGNGFNDKERSERHPDGHFMYYLPAELLKEINLVDTPGTNVILKRQQRLTEEFVPRADLVLFVLSADRPFTESEMTFLKYIMQWDKRIVFLLNKSDIFSDQKELEEVVKFVKDNAQQLLSVEKATIYAVSARKAFQAKNEVGVDSGNLDVEELLQNSAWNVSGFRDLEKFIADFLGGSSDAGAERRRLKLATPLGIALTLLEACRMQLTAEAKKADTDLESLNSIRVQLDAHQRIMENNSALQRKQVSALIDGAKGRAAKFVDSTLRISNIDAVASYLLGGDRQGTLPVAGSFDAQVMGSLQNDLQETLEENHKKLSDYRAQQVAKYRDLVRRKWPDIRERQEGKKGYVVSSCTEGKDENSLIVLEGFDTKAAKIVLEKELKDVIFVTFGGLGAAGLSASVLTSILPNTLEDLLALAVCSAGGLVGVWNLPRRREEVKGKILQVAESFANQLKAAMLTEARQNVSELRKEVDELLQPYSEAAEAEVERIRSLQEGISEADSKIQSLRLRVQNLGIS